MAEDGSCLRRAVLDDAEAIAGVEAAAAAHPWSATQTAATLASRTGAGFVIERDGPGVWGHVLASAVAGEGEVLTVAVHPDRRRRGLARRLLAACESWWHEQGVAQAFLEVARDNTAALALYRSLGWEQVGVRTGYYTSGQDALLLRKDLDPS